LEILMTMELSTTAALNGPAAPQPARSVSLDHAATLLGVSRRTIYNRIRAGRLKTVRTRGGSQRVLLDSVYESGDPLGPLARTSDVVR
jgi:excisionase family DNA binding protein